MRILIMGGTRFIGVYLTKILVEQGHEVVLFNRGNRPAPVEGVKQIKGDRTDLGTLKEKLAKEQFDAIFDNNGRELSDTQPLVEIFKDRVQHFVYMSSAGVYLKSDQLPHIEGDPVDPKSRHKGKHETEAYLAAQGIPFTAIRPTYIYGPQNYNDLEAWFFDRNVSGDRYVTFDGLARTCAEAAGKSVDTVQLVHYHPKQFDFGKRKAFPMRVQHFFADVHKAMTQLNWHPEFDLLSGLKDSFQNDYLTSSRDTAEVDFSMDDEILKAV
jgi:UDP-glucose 4-epimerase